MPKLFIVPQAYGLYYVRQDPLYGISLVEMKIEDPAHSPKAAALEFLQENYNYARSTLHRDILLFTAPPNEGGSIYAFVPIQEMAYSLTPFTDSDFAKAFPRVFELMSQALDDKTPPLKQ